MMVSSFPPEYPSLRTALRTANKLLKIWFAQCMPLTAKSELAIARKDHDQYWLSKENLEAQLATLDKNHALTKEDSISDTSLTRTLKQCHISELQYREASYRQCRELILSMLNKLRDDHCGIANEWKFTFCLYYDDKTDDDVLIDIQDLQAEQKRLSKYILNSLKQTTSIEKNDAIALVNMFMNIFRILERAYYGEEKNNFLHHYKWLDTWIKMSLGILEIGNELRLKEEKLDFPDEDIVKSVIFSSLSITCFVNYVSMTHIVVDIATSDLALLYAEHCVQTAERLYKKDIEKHVKDTSFRVVCKNKLYALKAMVDYKNKEFASFLDNINQIQESSELCLIVLDVWPLVGEYYQDKNPALSLKYYKKALDMLKELHTTPQSILRVQNLALEKRYQEIEARNVSQLRKKLRETFPDIKIRSTEKSDELYLFIPLKAIPNNYQRILFLAKLKHVRVQNVLNNVIDKQGNSVSGLQIITQSHYIDKIVVSLKRCLHLFEQEIERKNELNRVALSHVDEVSTQSYQALAFKEEAVVSSPKMRGSKKDKTSETITSIPPALTPPILEANPDCHAVDFGFKVTNNPLVTPVYFSEAGQKLRRAKLFVRFKGIPGVDETVEELFKGMLNPHPEGILIVSTASHKPGAKIWKHPDSLGERWDLCALRFKRRGASGWLRAVAEPEEKVTVMNQNGESENRYLFSLGRQKHK